MLKQLANKISNPFKAKAILGAFGFSGAERDAIDTLIAKGFNHRFLKPFVPATFRTAEGLITFILENPDVTESPWLGRVGGLLNDSNVRSVIADVLMEYIEGSDTPELYLSALEKIADADTPGFGDTQYADHRTFIADGLLPYVQNRLSGDNIDDDGLLFAHCPYCKESFMIGHEH